MDGWNKSYVVFPPYFTLEAFVREGRVILIFSHVKHVTNATLFAIVSECLIIIIFSCSGCLIKALLSFLDVGVGKALES